MKGRKPVPTALKLLRGNPGRRPISQDEPKPDESIPECPESLGKVAQREWNRVTPELLALKMICQLDLAVLAAYCNAFQQWVESSEKLSQTGFLIKAPSGYPIVNPLFSINNAAEAKMIRAAQELGLTPVQRTRIKVNSDNGWNEDDELTKFLKNK